MKSSYNTKEFKTYLNKHLKPKKETPKVETPQEEILSEQEEIKRILSDLPEYRQFNRG